MKGLYDLGMIFQEVGPRNCFISEITVAELKFGVANSKAQKGNRAVLNNFVNGIQILPIFPALDIYAKEKARLRKSGTIIDDFDLLPPPPPPPHPPPPAPPPPPPSPPPPPPSPPPPPPPPPPPSPPPPP